jgi:hypothetical protein
VFGDISDIEVDADGRLYVFDRQAQDVRVFNPDGSYVRTIGRSGRGPGEFIANGIAIDSAERLWVFNQGNMRYSVFDSAGALVTEMRRMVSGVRFAEWMSTFDADGALYDVLGYRDSSGIQFRLGRYDTVAQVFVDTFLLPQFPETAKLFSTVTTLTPVGWWVGVKDNYSLAKLTFAGDTTRIVELDRQPAALTVAERDSALQYERELRQRVARGEYHVETSLRPMFERVVVDDRGYMWVMLSADPTDARTRLDVFDPDGRYLGQVRAPHLVDRFVAPTVRHDRIYYVTKDELEVPYVVAAEIRGRY